MASHFRENEKVVGMGWENSDIYDVNEKNSMEKFSRDIVRELVEDLSSYNNYVEKAQKLYARTHKLLLIT